MNYCKLDHLATVMIVEAGSDGSHYVKNGKVNTAGSPDYKPIRCIGPVFPI